MLAEFLAKYVANNRGDIAAFARSVGVTPGQITNILKGRRCPRPEVLLSWAPHLPEAARDEWRRLVLEVHTPEFARLIQRRLESELARLRQEVADLAAENARLQEKLHKVRRDA
jgi:hypothetical protein